jgi:amidase
MKQMMKKTQAALVVELLLLAGCASTELPLLPRGIESLPSLSPPTSARFAPEQIVFMSASELARRIRQRELSSVMVVRAFARQIAAHNKTFNAIVLLDYRGAIKRARQADAALKKGTLWGPLHGVPVTIKDSFATRGLRTTAAHRPLAAHVPENDATIVALLREAGAIILAKTNLATLAMDMQTDNELFGRANNAWDVTRTTGGSSGGCSAALATGMTPLSFGSDLAGSLRIPSSFNGIYALKPTFGVVSLRGHIPPVPGETNGIYGMAVVGPLARSVEDLELALSILAKPHRSDRSPRRLAPRPQTSKQALAGLKIAYIEQLGGVPVSREIKAALAHYVEALRKAGATVTRAQPPNVDYRRVWETWGALVGMQGGYERSNVARWFARRFVGGMVRDVPMQRKILDGHSIERYMQTLGAQRAHIDAMENFLTDYDAWIVPTASTVAFAHHRHSDTFDAFRVYKKPLLIDGKALHYYIATQAYTTIFSVTESPVVSMPIASSKKGLPIGVQVVGRRFEDWRLLQVVKLLAGVAKMRPYPLQRKR